MWHVYMYFCVFALLKYPREYRVQIVTKMCTTQKQFPVIDHYEIMECIFVDGKALNVHLTI